MIDLHCHILPYADDGAANMDEALELLSWEAEQGVETVCLTPHFRSEMFETTDEKIRTLFARLTREAADNEIPLRLFLSREYYYDTGFLEKLHSGQILPMGNTVLVEFSYGSAFRTLEEAALEVKAAGYQPLFAHVERYEVIQEEPEIVQSLSDMGVLLQVNAASILGREGWFTKRLAKRLLKSGCISVVASDAHDTVVRIPELGKCRKYLEKKFGREAASEWLLQNPLSILSNVSKKE